MMSTARTPTLITQAKRARVVLADPQKLVLDGLRSVLAPAFEIVASVGDGQSLITEAQKLRPELILSEVSLPVIDGISAAARIREMLPECKFVFVTMQSDGTSVMTALRAGGTGYILKSCSSAELMAAIRDVLNGKTYITSGLKQAPAEGFWAPEKHGALHNLTQREFEVLKLVSQGHSYRMIANVLRVSAKTVAFHKTNIRRKLALQTTAELVKFALRNGIVES